tara:strand:- start:2091 stop:2747 length:657 start_codon:yes stop_codon:yes gene_type:complete
MMSSTSRKTDFGFLKIYLTTDRRLLPEGRFLEGVEKALAAGIRAIHLREKDLSPENLLPLAKEVLSLTRNYGARLLVNTHVDLANEIGADGVQLTEKCPSVAEIKRRFPHLLAGVSTHSLESAMDAESKGADFITFSPVFDTPSKRVYGKPQGLQKLREIANRIAIPVVALGGIKLENVSSVISRGAFGIALISGVWMSPNIEDTIRQLIQLTSGDLL